MTAIFELVEVRHNHFSPYFSFILILTTPISRTHLTCKYSQQIVSLVSFSQTRILNIRKIGWKFWVEWESSPDLLFTFFFLAHIFHIHSKFLLIVFQMQSSVIFLQLILRIFWHIHNHLLQIKFLIQLCDMQTTKSFVEQSSSQNYLAFWN